MTTHSAIRRSLVASLALAAATLLLAGPAQADVITVVNPSFESPVLADGGLNNNSSAPITGWVNSHINGEPSYTYNPTNFDFTGSAGSGTPAGADGANVLMIKSTANNRNASVIQNLTGQLLTLGTTYRLTVAIGDFANYDAVSWSISIGTTSTVSAANYLATTSGTAAQLINDTFTDFSVQYTATGTKVGEDLRIRLFAANASGTAVSGPIPRVAFDNVRFEIIPEPGTIAMLGAGTLLLLAARRRRQQQASRPAGG